MYSGVINHHLIASRGRAGPGANSPRLRSPNWRGCWTPGPALRGYTDQYWTLARIADLCTGSQLERVGPGLLGRRAG